MGAALILYGSRARGEARPDSDLDLIFASEGTSIAPPKNGPGFSIHFYSKGWLEAESKDGNLFVNHVAFEGVALNDTSQFLHKLRKLFKKKSSYRPIKEESLLILRMLIESDWNDNFDIRRRYFWAVRTILICESADLGTPKFSSHALENISGVMGLAAHIDDRASASYKECRRVGQNILKAFGARLMPDLYGNSLREHLLAGSNIARDSVRVIEELEAVEASGLQMYL